MAYGFNDKKEKVNISTILNGLQTTFQNNVNAIYNAIVKNGVTPTAQTPAACATAIKKVRNKTTISIMCNPPYEGYRTDYFHLYGLYPGRLTIKCTSYIGNNLDGAYFGATRIDLNTPVTFLHADSEIEFSVKLKGTYQTTEGVVKFEFEWLDAGYN